MGETRRMSRRAFLGRAGIGGAALLAGKMFGVFDPLSAFGALKTQTGAFVADAEIAITAAEKTVQILAGKETRVWSYSGDWLSGSGVTVTNLPGNYLGPIVRIKSGTQLKLNFHNKLAENSILHPHGIRVPEQYDGHPMDAIGPGKTLVYEIPVIDNARPAWFHPHPMMRTSEQVVMGMAGLFYIWDDEEETAVPGARTGANDIPLIIQDRIFDGNNQIYYSQNMMTNMMGYLGNRILVNGQVDSLISLEPRAYRLRLLNGSNARSFRLAWSNNMLMSVIGTDGGLLPAVEKRNYVMLMPGERVDLWVDFSTVAGRQLTLRSLPWQAMSMGGMMGGGMMGSGMMSGGMMGGGMMGGMGMMNEGMMGGMANGAAFDILKINVDQKVTANPVLGPLPAIKNRFTASNVANFAAPVPFVLAVAGMMNWTINGRVYEETGMPEADEIVKLNVPIAWEWVNNSPIAHPMHIHNVQFQVVQRTPSPYAGYATVKDGFVDSGWKDTVMVYPGERVKVAMNFEPYTGMYMYHCHILEHEDMTMMRNFSIVKPGDMGM